jgi:hypothetical protein
MMNLIMMFDNDNISIPTLNTSIVPSFNQRRQQDRTGLVAALTLAAVGFEETEEVQEVHDGQQSKATAANATAAADTATSSAGVLDWILNDYELSERAYEQLDKVTIMKLLLTNPEAEVYDGRSKHLRYLCRRAFFLLHAEKKRTKR